MIVLLGAAGGAACGKVTLDGPPGAVDAQVPARDASPGAPDANDVPDARPGPDARSAPDAALPPDAGSPCADGELQRRDPATGACYMLFRATRLDWYDANRACEDLEPSAHLVTVSTAEEHALTVEMAGSNNTWLGAHDLMDLGAEEGTFQWVTGEPMTFEAWADGEPNNGEPDGPDEDCAMLLVTDASRPESWDDRPCGSRRAYLCERE